MDKRPPIVVGIGEILWDIFEDRKTLGGAPANFAYHATQQGAEGIAVSAIGDDAAGDAILSTLAGKSLKTEFQRVPQATGSVHITLDANGVAHYRFPPDVAWDNLAFSDSLKLLAQRCDAACFGTLAQRAPRSRASILAFFDAMPKTALRVFDVNLRQNFYSELCIRESLTRADILKINEEEMATLAAFFALPENTDFDTRRKRFSATLFAEFSSLKIILLSCGAHGSYAIPRNGEVSFIPSDPETRIVDTVGAGDSFTATFTVARLAGKSVSEAHRQAVRVAEFVCSQAGAMPEIPR